MLLGVTTALTFPLECLHAIALVCLQLPSNVKQMPGTDEVLCETAHYISQCNTRARLWKLSSESVPGSPSATFNSGASQVIWLDLVVILIDSLDKMSRDDEITGLSFTDPWGELSAS
jgi:hypothetical protein